MAIVSSAAVDKEATVLRVEAGTRTLAALVRLRTPQKPFPFLGRTKE